MVLGFGDLVEARQEASARCAVRIEGGAVDGAEHGFLDEADEKDCSNEVEGDRSEGDDRGHGDGDRHSDQGPAGVEGVAHEAERTRGDQPITSFDPRTPLVGEVVLRQRRASEPNHQRRQPDRPPQPLGDGDDDEPDTGELQDRCAQRRYGPRLCWNTFDLPIRFRNGRHCFCKRYTSELRLPVFRWTHFRYSDCG